MRRGHHHRVERAAGVEQLHAQALLVDRDRHRLEARRGELGPAGRARRVLDGDAAPAARDQRAAEEGHPLRHAGGHDHPLRVAGRAAHATEVGGEGRAQLGRPARVAVVEPRVGSGAQRAAQRREPGVAREQRDVRAVRAGSRSAAGAPRPGRARPRRPARAPARRASRRPGGPPGSPRRRAASRPRRPRRATRRARARARGSRGARCRAEAAPRARPRAAAPRPAP